jgi:CubicO group peptidase (beta-lactamase class C family)
MPKKFLFSLALIVSFIPACLSQTGWITIKGRIIDISTRDPLSYATISITARGINTMSNENGEFAFRVPIHSKTDSILVTHVGYRKLALPINDSKGVLVIELQKDVARLEEVTVQAVNALALIKKAILKIPENYPSSPYLVTGFYRLTGDKQRQIVHMSEAVFGIYNETYARKNKQVKLIKARFDKDMTAFNGNNAFNFGSSPEDILDYDIVSNVDESDILDKQQLKYYDFTYKGVINYNGVKAHQIAFDQKDGIKKALKQGTIIVDAQGLAFLEFRYRLSPRGIKYWDLGFAKKAILSLSRIRIDLLQDSSTVTYRRYGSKYYLNHVKGVSFWHIVGGRDRFELNPFRLKNNYLVTSIDTAGIEPFKSNELIKSTRFLENTAEGDYLANGDPFWNEYNLIQAEFDVDSVAKIIHKNNQSLNYKELLEAKLSKYKKDRAVRIDSILSFYHNLRQFNGAALVAYEGKVIYEKEFGSANREKNIPNTRQTQFRIGSASKQFTSMLIMQLAKEGKLNVGDPVSKFLPGYVHGAVTIEQLMTHRSGIPNYTNNQEHLAKTIIKEYSLEELVRLFCSDSLEFEPGTDFHYTNSGYVVLALVIEKITGKKYAEVLAEKIFTPLGMKSSFFGSRSPLSTNMAIGYVNDEPEMAYAVENIAGAGGITSTTEDLLRWNHALSSMSLLPVAEMNDIFKPRAEWKEWGANYGYGWMIDRLMFKSSDKHVIQYHPGTEPGFYTMLARQPDKGIVIVLLNNSGEFPRFEITDLILRELNQ